LVGRRQGNHVLPILKFKKDLVLPQNLEFNVGSGLRDPSNALTATSRGTSGTAICLAPRE
jgi:hypothetical protein